MNIRIKSIPHSEQRYSTCGDWVITDNSINIYVSDTGNLDYNFLIGIHELIEVWLCNKDGIKQEDVDNFDIQFEKERKLGQHGDKEPGFDKNAPYRDQHTFATKIEKLIAKKLGVEWDKYDKAIESL